MSTCLYPFSTLFPGMFSLLDVVFEIKTQEKKFFNKRSNYINNVLFRSLTELQHIALVNYPDYCAPVESGEISEQESRKLWFNIEKQLNNCISTVNLRLAFKLFLNINLELLKMNTWFDHFSTEVYILPKIHFFPCYKKNFSLLFFTRARKVKKGKIFSEIYFIHNIPPPTFSFS